MPFKKGEVYVCPDEDCGCELTVTKGAPESCQGSSILPVVVVKPW